MKDDPSIKPEYGKDDTPRWRAQYRLILLLIVLVVTIAVFWLKSMVKIASP
jgi:hypothetical protein